MSLLTPTTPTPTLRLVDSADLRLRAMSLHELGGEVALLLGQARGELHQVESLWKTGRSVDS